MTERLPTRHTGRCHCGAVVFAIVSDFPELTTCDCSICRRKNALMVKVPESAFELLQGEDALTLYQFHTHTAKHYFCKVFGINVFCLDGFDPSGIPVRATVGAGMP